MIVQYFFQTVVLVSVADEGVQNNTKIWVLCQALATIGKLLTLRQTHTSLQSAFIVGFLNGRCGG